MLTLLADQPECLWDDALPVEVKELPPDLAALDVLLADHEVLWPLVGRWRREFRETGRLVLTEGRPTIPLETYVRLMVLKQRYRWGYRRWSRRCRTRFTCGGSAGSHSRCGYRTVDGPQAHPADRRRDRRHYEDSSVAGSLPSAASRRAGSGLLASRFTAISASSTISWATRTRSRSSPTMWEVTSPARATARFGTAPTRSQTSSFRASPNPTPSTVSARASACFRARRRWAARPARVRSKQRTSDPAPGRVSGAGRSIVPMLGTEQTRPSGRWPSRVLPQIETRQSLALASPDAGARCWLSIEALVDVSASSDGYAARAS